MQSTEYYMSTEYHLRLCTLDTGPGLTWAVRCTRLVAARRQFLVSHLISAESGQWTQQWGATGCHRVAQWAAVLCTPTPVWCAHCAVEAAR